MTQRDTKICVRCGRAFSWRRKWADAWDEIKMCSKRCRQMRLTPDDQALEDTIVRLLEARGRRSTICPSEAARLVRPEDWREWMERTRMAARRLVAADTIEFVQEGRVVDPSRAKGPIRLRLR